VLAGREPNPPRFIIPDWLPEGYATLLSGHGGVGKSYIAMTLGACIAAGVRFFGLDVEPRRVLYLSCEDREDVLHWRLSRICKHLGIDLTSLRSKLDILDLVGSQCVLWQRDPSTGLSVTSAVGELEARMRAQQTQVLIGDGVADLYGGNENARPEVKSFINLLLGLIPLDGAAILIGHVDKVSAINGAASQGYAGSAQWHNGMRGRWYLYPEREPDAASEHSSGNLVLELRKSNHGTADQQLIFRWHEEAHLFLPADAASLSTHANEQERESAERMGILCAMRACADVTVPAALSGQRTAFSVLSVRRELPVSVKQGRKGRERFKERLEQLRQSGLICEQPYTRQDRHKGLNLVITAQGQATLIEWQRAAG
jgi:RecA-family ATPase